MKLKAWIARGDDYHDEPQAEAVFATTRKAARRIAWRHGDVDLRESCDCSRAHLTLVRTREFDRLAKPEKVIVGEVGYVARDYETLRQMRFGLEGDNTCASCGLAEFDGQWPVCPGCHQCPDCGHDDDCPERVTDSKREAE